MVPTIPHGRDSAFILNLNTIVLAIWSLCTVCIWKIIAPLTSYPKKGDKVPCSVCRYRKCSS